LDPAVALGHRQHHAVEQVAEARELADSLLGSTGVTGLTTFELRVRHTGGEAWEPVIVVVGGGHDVDASMIGEVGVATGMALLAVRANGCGTSLRPNGASWVLEPLGIELTPVGLSDDEVCGVAELLGEPEPVIDISGPVGIVDRVEPVEPVPPAPAWALMVRLFGGVEVVDREGATVPFDRSKTRELVAWLATHRERSTRTAARTALWEMDVRDATFANVVSEARRSMARLVEPSPGSEWLGRTLTEELPLHCEVVTDADLVRHARTAAAGRPAAEAIAVLAPAVELLRGMPFEGTSYLWPDAEGITSNLVLLGTGAAAELAAHCLSIGDVPGVFDATARGLAVLPGHEELIALRMRAHGAAGDRAGVRHEWERYERTVVADPWSDGEPAPKLVQLRRELLSSSST
jgi:Bacterial transcriptional activator domain